MQSIIKIWNNFQTWMLFIQQGIIHLANLHPHHVKSHVATKKKTKRAHSPSINCPIDPLNLQFALNQQWLSSVLISKKYQMQSPGWNESWKHRAEQMSVTQIGIIITTFNEKNSRKEKWGNHYFLQSTA